jgi:drug/metabolite transporter (DMT)-like permease
LNFQLLNFQLSRLDLLLLLMVLIWGSNFSLVKVALADFPELAFNASRLIVASTVFLLALWRRGEPQHAVPPRDWRRLAVLGVVGTLLYQLCFLAGVKRTSVGNASLITGSSPIVIAVLASLAGHERVSPRRWVGVLLALAGLYLVVGHGVALTAASRTGDGLMIASMFCWAVFSAGAQPLLKTQSPLVVTGLSFVMGSVLYVLVTLPVLVGVEWQAIHMGSWIAMAVSGLLALSVAYLIWYTAIERLGTTRTAVYSYLTPVIAMVVAAAWLGEPITGNQLAGAGAILTGVALTRGSS